MQFFCLFILLFKEEAAFFFFFFRNFFRKKFLSNLFGGSGIFLSLRFVIIIFFSFSFPCFLLKHAGIGHAMVNILHYMVDIILIVLYFGLPWIFRYLFLFCLLLLKVSAINSKVVEEFHHSFCFLSALSLYIYVFIIFLLPSSPLYPDNILRRHPKRSQKS